MRILPTAILFEREHEGGKLDRFQKLFMDTNDLQFDLTNVSKRNEMTVCAYKLINIQDFICITMTLILIALPVDHHGQFHFAVLPSTTFFLPL